MMNSSLAEEIIIDVTGVDPGRRRGVGRGITMPPTVNATPDPAYNGKERTVPMTNRMESSGQYFSCILINKAGAVNIDGHQSSEFDSNGL